MSTNATSQPLLVGIAEAAAMLAVSDRTIRNMVARGELAAVRLGNRRGALRFSAADLRQWVERQVAASTSA